jgi:hypothetical protein
VPPWIDPALGQSQAIANVKISRYAFRCDVGSNFFAHKLAPFFCSRAEPLPVAWPALHLELQILGDAIGDLSGKAINRASMKCPFRPLHSTLCGVKRSALRCVVWSGAWVVGRRKHMCHTAYICATQHIFHTAYSPHVEETWCRHNGSK